MCCSGRRPLPCYAQAVAAEATTVMPPADMFWRDRYGQLHDPFGVLWTMNQQGR